MKEAKKIKKIIENILRENEIQETMFGATIKYKDGETEVITNRYNILQNPYIIST